VYLQIDEELARGFYLGVELIFARALVKLYGMAELLPEGDKSSYFVFEDLDLEPD